LVGKLRRDSVPCGSGFADPVRQVAHEVEEEVALGDRYHFVGDLDEQAEALAGPEIQALTDVLAEVFRSGAGVDLERLVGVVREVHLVEDLSRLVLNRLDFDLVRGVLPLSVPQRLLEPLQRILRDGVSAAPQKHGQFLLEALRTGEQPRGQPHQLPPPLLRQSVPVVGQLLHHLTVDLVPQDLVLERAVEDVIGVLVTQPRPLRRQVPHILQYGAEGEARLLRQLLLHEQLFEERLFDGVARVAPQLISASARRRQSQSFGHRPLDRGAEVVDCVLGQRVGAVPRLRTVH
jgi:hypothetical protein